MRVWLPGWSCSRSTFDLGFHGGDKGIHRLLAQIHRLGPVNHRYIGNVDHAQNEAEVMGRDGSRYRPVGQAASCVRSIASWWPDRLVVALAGLDRGRGPRAIVHPASRQGGKVGRPLALPLSQ